jgi:hypothetical protein
MAAKYTIEGGHAGKARLDVLAGVCAPGTTRCSTAWASARVRGASMSAAVAGM